MLIPGEDTTMGDQSYSYLSTDDMKILADDSVSPTKVRTIVFPPYT